MANAASQDHLENNISRSAHIWVNSVETCLAFNRLSEQTRRLQADDTKVAYGRSVRRVLIAVIIEVGHMSHGCNGVG
jgi:hypothetical protein